MGKYDRPLEGGLWRTVVDVTTDSIAYDDGLRIGCQSAREKSKEVLALKEQTSSWPWRMKEE